MTRSVVNPRLTDINLARLAVSSPVINTNATLTATSIPTRVRRARRFPRDSPARRDSLCRTSNGAVREIINAGAAPARRLAMKARSSAHPAPIQSTCRGPRKSSAGGRYRCMAGTMPEAKRMPSPPPPLPAQRFRGLPCGPSQHDLRLRLRLLRFAASARLRAPAGDLLH